MKDKIFNFLKDKVIGVDLEKNGVHLKDKGEDDLTPDEKREFRRLNESIDKEKKIVEGIQAQQKATMDGFNKAVAEAKTRNGK